MVGRSKTPEELDAEARVQEIQNNREQELGDTPQPENKSINQEDNVKDDTIGDYKPIAVIEDWDLNYCLGNCVKHIARASIHMESSLENLEEALWYLQREVDNRIARHSRRVQPKGMEWDK